MTVAYRVIMGKLFQFEPYQVNKKFVLSYFPVGDKLPPEPQESTGVYVFDSMKEVCLFLSTMDLAATAKYQWVIQYLDIVTKLEPKG